MTDNKRRDELQTIIIRVLKEMDSQGGSRGIHHTRWEVQEEVCGKYMEYFGMTGYNPERMSENITDHPEWEDNPRFNDFFLVERSTDVAGTPNVFLRNAPLFSEVFFQALLHLARKGLVKLEMKYERNKVGCCGAADAKGDGTGVEPKVLQDIQKVGLMGDP